MEGNNNMPIRWRVLDKEDYKEILIFTYLILQYQIVCFYRYGPFYVLILPFPYWFILMLSILGKLKKKGVHKVVVLGRTISIEQIMRIILIISLIVFLISIHYIHSL